MILSELKTALHKAISVDFILPDNTPVPEHFHVTEVGIVKKDFIDCGGTIRNENVISLQLWSSDDVDHRLKPQKLLCILDLSERTLSTGDYEIEVGYQADTIGRYGLEFNGEKFILTKKQTACLASDACGTPSGAKEPLSTINTSDSCCTPGGGCC